MAIGGYDSQDNNSFKASKSLLKKDLKQLEEGTLGRIPETQQQQMADRAAQASRRGLAEYQKNLTRSGMGNLGTGQVGRAAEESRKIAEMAGEQEAIASMKAADISEQKAERAEQQARANLTAQQERRRQNVMFGIQSAFQGVKGLIELGSTPLVSDAWSSLEEAFLQGEDSDPSSGGLNLGGLNIRMKGGKKLGESQSLDPVEAMGDAVAADAALPEIGPQEPEKKPVAGALQGLGRAATGALGGAATGSTFGPVGTAVGGAIGALGGLFTKKAPEIADRRQELMIRNRQLSKLDPGIWASSSDAFKEGIAKRLNMSPEDITGWLQRREAQQQAYDQMMEEKYGRLGSLGKFGG